MVVLLILLILVISFPVAIAFIIAYSNAESKVRRLEKENLRLKQLLASLKQGEGLNEVKPVQQPKSFKIEAQKTEAPAIKVETKKAPDVISETATNKSVVYDANPNPAPVNKVKQQSLNWIHIGLIIGVIFVFISSIIFATTTWTYLPSFIKVIIITMSTVIMYFSSYIFEKLKLFSASKAFHFIGLSLLFINVIALAFFELLPYGNCFSFYNKYLTFSLATFVVALGLVFSVKKYKMEVLRLLCLTSFFISIMLLINYFLVYSISQVIIVLTLNIILVLINIDNKTFKSFKIIALYIGLLFIFTNYSLHSIWYILVYIYGLLFFVTGEKKSDIVYVCTATFITLIASFNISSFFDNFELAMIVINLCSCLIILLFSHLKLIKKNYFVSLILTYTCLSFIMYIIASRSNILIIFITLLNIFGIYLIIRKSTNKVLQAIPICLLLIWLLKFFELYYSRDSYISSYIVYIIFVALYIINIFVKKLYRNSFVDVAFMLLISFTLISELVLFSSNFLYLFYISQYLISNIVIFKERNSYISQVVSVLSVLIFTTFFAWSMSDMFVSLTMLLIFLVFAAVIIYAIRAYNKHQSLVLKVYQEVATFTFMYVVLYSCILTSFIGSIKLFDLFFGLTILILTFMLITSNKLYSRYVMPYVIIIFGTITFTQVIEFLFTPNIMFWTYASKLIVFIGLLLVTTIFHNNKYLKLFKLPIFLSTSLYTFLLYSQVNELFRFSSNFYLTEANELIYFVFTLIIIFVVYIFTCKQKALLGSIVPVTTKVMSLVAGVWVVIWYELHFSLIYYMMDENMKRLYFIFAYILVILVSTIIKKLSKNNNYINMFHVLSFMLIFAISVEEFYEFILYAIYFISLNDIIKNRVYNLIIRSLATTSLVLAFTDVSIISIPTQITLEYLCLLFGIIATLLYLYWKSFSKYIIYIYEVFIVILSLLLLSNALVRDELLNVSIIFIISISILITAIIRRNLSWFIPYVIIVTIIVVYFTRDFWTSISWWIYLFVAGVTLITIAVINEFKLKKSSKSFRTVIKNRLEAWKW